MKKRITKFSKNTSLGMALEELEYNGLQEITRIIPAYMSKNGKENVFEYNVE